MPLLEYCGRCGTAKHPLGCACNPKRVRGQLLGILLVISGVSAWGLFEYTAWDADSQMQPEAARRLASPPAPAAPQPANAGRNRAIAAGVCVVLMATGVVVFRKSRAMPVIPRGSNVARIRRLLRH